MQTEPESRLKNLTPHSIQSLSPQLRRAAHYVVENLGEVATRSQRSIARNANLPAPTFTRMARAIGYASYDALRESCREEILGSRNQLARKAQALIDADDRNSGIATRQAAAAISNTEALVAALAPGELDTAVDMLARARRVALIGEMSALPIVEYAHYLANMSLTGWIVPGRGGNGLANDLADLGSDDACILFSIRHYAARAIAIAGSISAPVTGRRPCASMFLHLHRKPAVFSLSCRGCGVFRGNNRYDRSNEGEGSAGAHRRGRTAKPPAGKILAGLACRQQGSVNI